MMLQDAAKNSLASACYERTSDGGELLPVGRLSGYPRMDAAAWALAALRAHRDEISRGHVIPAHSAPQSREFPGSVMVLLVEDSFVLSQRIAELVSAVAHVELLDTVDTEKKAVASLRRRHIDIVVLDLHLKEGTGFGVLRAIGVMQHKPRVIVMTNYDLPEYRKAAISLGATLYLDKARD